MNPESSDDRAARNTVRACVFPLKREGSAHENEVGRKNMEEKEAWERKRPARPPHPERPGSARADRSAYRVWGGREGAVGDQEFRRASGGLRETGGRAHARRALGGVEGWSHTRWARTQGTIDHRIDC